MLIKNSSLLKQSDNIVRRTLGGKVVLVPISQAGLETHKIYSLNETASAIWDRLDKATSLVEISTAMLEEYSVDPEELNREITRTLDDFLEAGVATIVEE